MELGRASAFQHHQCQLGRGAVDQYTKMLNFLNATTTQRGLVVKATLCETKYATSIKIPDERMASLNLLKHDTLPRWHYTIRPNHLVVPS
jgi:hypothetical protein